MVADAPLAQVAPEVLMEGVTFVDALLSQIVGVTAIAAWTVLTTALVFGALTAAGQARVSPEHEREGLDVTEHGVETYPEFGDEGTIITDGGYSTNGNDE